MHQKAAGVNIQPAALPEPHTRMMGYVYQREGGFSLFCTKALSITTLVPQGQLLLSKGTTFSCVDLGWLCFLPP